MLITGIIVKTLPDKAEQTMQQLQAYPQVTTYGVYRGDNIVAVVEAEAAVELETLSRQIVEECDDALGVYPAYLTSDEATL